MDGLMMLLTQQLKDRFLQVGSQEEVKDPVVIAHYFHPYSSRHWYATGYDDVEQLFFGFVDGVFGERWSFWLNEMKDIIIFGLPLERDLHREEKPFSEIKFKDDA